MKRLHQALPSSRIIPFIYSYAPLAGVRFLVEVAENRLRVFSRENENTLSLEADFSGTYNISRDFSFYQINALLVLVSETSEPMALKFENDKSWTFQPWKMKHAPYRYVHEKRDTAITVSTDAQGLTNVKFSPEEAPEERSLSHNDQLRASVWVDIQKVKSKQSSLSGVVSVSSVPSSCVKGTVVAVLWEESVKTWVCIDEWNKERDYIEGLEDPSNFPSKFSEKDYQGDLSNRAYRLGDFGNFARGDSFNIVYGAWNFFTCIKTYTNQSGISFSNNEYFVKGVRMGNPVPCGTKWSFSTNGEWWGAYSINRSYESKNIASASWQEIAVATSELANPSNPIVSGDESSEECYLDVRLIKSRAFRQDNFYMGFPPDSCGNMLLVESYKHDYILKLEVSQAEDGSLSSTWSDVTPIRTNSPSYNYVTYDWSWRAFSPRYGYPRLVTRHNRRLVFASTPTQPQTLFFSQTDDYNNFLTGISDTAAMQLTMDTPTQNPICWIQSQQHRLLLGTSEAEWVITGGDRESLTSANAQIQAHGYFGSAPCRALMTDNKVLYVKRGSSRVYEYGYSMEYDGYRSKDITVMASTLLSEHQGVTDNTLMEAPDIVAVFALGDGQIALCTYNSLQNVNAWHRWKTRGKVTSVCAMPDADKGDKLYLVVEREIFNSETGQRENTPLIEVVDATCSYKDNDEDYTSTMVTNSLISPIEQRVGKMPQLPTWYLFGEDFDQEKGTLELCTSGGEWHLPDRNRTIIRKGWNNFIPNAKWSVDATIGVRVYGDAPFTLYALQ